MKKLRERFHNQKLNIKFTCLITALLVVPSAILGGILFYYMERNVVKENVNYMEYTMQRNQDAIQAKIDSINMSTQFFLSDEALIKVLEVTWRGGTLSAEEWYSFKTEEIAALERLVNNNPLLYGVRVYAINDEVQEMMPILYQKTRMEKQEWAAEAYVTGWHFNYQDDIFSSYTINQKQKLVGLVTPMVVDKKVLGVVESAMTMDTMFPSFYEKMEGEWACFYTDAGEVFFGDNEIEQSRQLLEKIHQKKRENETINTEYMCIDGTHLVVSYLKVSELSGTLICVKDITKNVRNVYSARNIFVLAMLVIISVLAYVVNIIVRGMLGQLYDILGSIRKVQKGDLNVVIENCGNDEMGELGFQINTMLERIRQLMEDNLKREMLMKNSEIRALQNQINAHFIYNVLESIKMMAELEEKYDISDAVTSLGKLLRYSMKWVSKNVLVKEELEYIRNYMALINLRFDYEIYLAVNVPEEIARQEIPKMSLQPIVENAIYHGIEQMAEDTTITIKGVKQGKDSVIEITDAGKGMTEEEVIKLRKKISGELDSNGGSGNGIGLKNVQDRIHISFGEEYGMEIHSKLGCYTKICVKIPFKEIEEGM